MANIKRSVPENIPGDFFVDTSCIDCDTCRQLAPAVFGETGKFAYVHHQPETDTDQHSALQALVCCPTGSIGWRKSATAEPARPTGEPLSQLIPLPGNVLSAKEVMADFPLLLEAPVYYCGFASPKSYGGSSYFVQHPAGNWLIDSPKFVTQLVGQFERRGGIANIFLTHQDDVADARQYAEHFGSRRIIHRAELDSQPDAEWVLEGQEPVELAPGFVALPTPGHTAGHLCLLVKNRFLFTGDHLSWSRARQRLSASQDYCWHSWPEQTDSMARLSEHSFQWILPGHGQRVYLPADEMRQQMQELVVRMRG